MNKNQELYTKIVEAYENGETNKDTLASIRCLREDDSPLFTGCTGVAYSMGYSFRCASIAVFTRWSSCIETVLIQVIASVLCVLG